jgi:hypothetical protein
MVYNHHARAPAAERLPLHQPSCRPPPCRGRASGAFSEQIPKRRAVEHGLGEQLPELAVLILQPPPKGRLRDPVTPAQFCRSCHRFALAQYTVGPLGRTRPPQAALSSRHSSALALVKECVALRLTAITTPLVGVDFPELSPPRTGSDTVGAIGATFPVRSSVHGGRHRAGQKS